MDAAMDACLRADRLASSMGGRRPLPNRRDEDVSHDRCDVPHLARGVTVHARIGYEGPDQHTVRETEPRAKEWLGKCDESCLVRLVEGDSELSKGSIRTQLLVW
jgi:hypothetical protein